MSELETTTSSEPAKKRWYVLQAFSGFENRVAVTLREYIKLHKMEDSFGEVLVPTEEIVENVGGKRRKTERKFFPGYVLVEMEMNDYTWQLVRSVPRVMGFILNRVQETAEKPRHRNEYHPGENVRVTEGPFADFTGTVEEVDYEKGRVKVSVSIFGRATPVELEFNQVEKQ